MKKQLQKIVLAAVVALTASVISSAQTTSTFESLSLTPNSHWDGSASPLGATFSDGNAIFPNYYDTSFGGYWASGWAYSNMTDSTAAGFTNLFSAITAIGYNGSSNYAVGQQNAIINLDTTAIGKVVNGFYVTNGTYAALSMRDGDAFAKKFGGTSGNDPDWFKLTIRKWYDGVMTNDSIEFYLADYRFANNAQDYIVKTWQWVDLTPLGNVDSLLFTLSSSDVSAYGMNTPAFFCIDNFTTADITTAINETKSNTRSISLFPNPSSEMVNINLNNHKVGAMLVRVMDATGKLVYFKNTNATVLQIPVSQLPAGIYNISVSGNNYSVNKSFIKQ